MNINRQPRFRVRLKSLTGRQWTAIVLIATGAIVFAVLLMTGLSRLLSRPTAIEVPPEQPVGAATPPSPTPVVPKIKATLYFVSEDGLHLVPTEREVPLAEGPVAQARSILEAQLSAEPQAPLVSTMPKGAALRGIFVSERNEVFVDLDPAIRASHPGGTLNELMTVYAIVNAVLTNLPNLQEVQILIGGQEADTLAGHVDLRRPLKKNESIVAGSQ